jgi:hypothetical protein
MPAQHICKPNQTRAGFLLTEKAGLVWRCARQAFNKMLILSPFTRAIFIEILFSVIFNIAKIRPTCFMAEVQMPL